MPTNLSVLVVDDEPSLLRYMKTLLELEGCAVTAVPTGPDAVQQIREGMQPDVVFLDLLMPGMDGIETLEAIRELNGNLKVVMLSCLSETAKVVQCIRLGAQDYLNKPFRKADLESVIERFVAPPVPIDQAYELEELGEEMFFVAASPVMRRISAEVSLIAKPDVPVLMLGESGTGKEIVARLIHKRSSRNNRIFLKVNCAAIPPELLESELFGFEAGAFTGAVKAKPGRFEQCDGGTLFLDEVGEIPGNLQAKLLHVLQDGEFCRLGSRRSLRADVRVIAATNINMDESIANKSFREDLFYRLSTFCITIPPLRERREDIPILLKHMLSRTSDSYGGTSLQPSSALVEACTAAPWRGNVRELGNFVKRYVIVGDEQAAIAELRGLASKSAAEATPELQLVSHGTKPGSEYAAIKRALAQSGGNRKVAAGILNISYKELIFKMRDYGLNVPRRTTATGVPRVN